MDARLITQPFKVEAEGKQSRTVRMSIERRASRNLEESRA